MSDYDDRCEAREADEHTADRHAAEIAERDAKIVTLEERLRRMTAKRDRWRAFAQEVAAALGVEWRAMDGAAMMAQARERIKDAHERDQLAMERNR